MNRRLLALLAILAGLAGCRSLTEVCRFVHICSPRQMTLGPAIAPDFRIVVKVENQADPPADYLVTIRRDGTGEYNVERRAPSRRVSKGTLSVPEASLQRIWDAVAAADYPQLPDRIPESGDGTNVPAGVQSFNVNADEFPKQVVAAYASDPRLDAIRRAVLATLPEQAFADASPQQVTANTTVEVVGDSLTRRFYSPGSPLLKDVPAARRVAFATYYAAVDHGFEPGPDWRQPVERQR